MMTSENKLLTPKNRKKIRAFTQTFFAVLVTLIMAFPIYWMVNTALKSNEEIVSTVPKFWPSKLVWQNFVDAWTMVDYPQYIWNTLFVTAGHLVLQLTFSILAAYAFSRGRFKGRDFLFMVVLSGMMIPGQAVFIPVYLLITKTLHLTGDKVLIGMLVPGIVSANMIFMLRQNFRSVDQSYIDAGEMDGLGIFGTIRHVLMPMCKAAVVTVTLNSFIGGWNNYFWPKILTLTADSKYYLISVGLAKLISQWNDPAEIGNKGYYNTMLAAALISILPILVVFILNQKHLMKGYSKNAMK